MTKVFMTINKNYNQIHNQEKQTMGKKKSKAAAAANPLYRQDGEHQQTRTLTEEIIIPEPPEYDKIHLEMQDSRFLCQIFPQATMVGSIHTPDNKEIAIDRGRVVAIGPNVKHLKVGDIIFKMAGLGQALLGADKKVYTFHPEAAVIAVDTFPHELTPEPKPKPEIIT